MDKTVAELFAGVGGFRCAPNDVELGEDGKAIENGDWSFVFANQWEPSTKKQDAFDCYCKRFGGEDASNVNIFEVNKSELPDFSLLVGGFPCLTGDTLVLLSNGLLKRIDEIEPGIDEVIGHDGAPHMVTDLFNQGEKPVYRLYARGFSVDATLNHRFLASYQGGELDWYTVAEIYTNTADFGISTLYADDNGCKIEAVIPVDAVEDLYKDEQVFDIEVEDAHSFVANGFVSHNCQNYSVASTANKATGIEGEKGILWWAINEILNVNKPPFVFLENVDRLLISPSKQRGRDFGIILRCFYEAGYDVQWRVINAGEYGYQQKRRRTYIVAYRNDTRYAASLESKSFRDIIEHDGIFSQGFPMKEEFLKENETDVSYDAYDMLGHLSDEFRADFYNAGVMRNGKVYTAKVEADYDGDAYKLRDLLESDGVDEHYFLNDEKKAKFKYLKGSKKIPRKKPNGDDYIYSEGAMACPDNLDVPARTLLTSESGVSRMSHVVEDPKTGQWRLITPMEAERIDGFPDGWTDSGMSEKRRYFMMGNALVVDVVAVIGKAIEEIIEKED